MSRITRAFCRVILPTPYNGSRRCHMPARPGPPDFAVHVYVAVVLVQKYDRDREGDSEENILVRVSDKL